MRARVEHDEESVGHRAEFDGLGRTESQQGRINFLARNMMVTFHARNMIDIASF